MQPSRARRSIIREFRARRAHKPDYILVIVASVLLVVGLVVVFSIGPGLAAIKGVSENYYVNKQLLAILVGLVVFGVASRVPLSSWSHLSKALIILSVCSVAAVAMFGQRVDGATRWIQAGLFSFQPAELIKFALLIWLADFLTRRRKSGLMSDTRQTLYVLMGVVLAIGVFVAGLQSDLGSSAVIIAMIGTTALVAGLPLRKVGLSGLFIALILAAAIFSTPYRRARVATFLHPEADCQDAGYQACQALITIGSGGVLGKGLGNSVQAYGYLPAAANDSIFAIIGEKFGFFGSAVIVALYGILFTRLKRIIDHTADDFQRFVTVGLLSWLSTQAIINIGAMVGLLPLKGITLPFISFGGTSVLFVMAALGVVFNISKHTSFQTVPITDPAENEQKGTGNDNSRRRRRVGGAYHPQPRYRSSS